MGDAVGVKDGAAVGDVEGALVGWPVGALEGDAVGNAVGCADGADVGWCVGVAVVGIPVGADDGVAVGSGVGGREVVHPSPVHPPGHGKHMYEPAVFTHSPSPLHGELRTVHSSTSSAQMGPCHAALQLQSTPAGNVATHPLISQSAASRRMIALAAFKPLPQIITCSTVLVAKRSSSPLIESRHPIVALHCGSARHALRVVEHCKAQSGAGISRLVHELVPLTEHGLGMSSQKTSAVGAAVGAAVDGAAVGLTAVGVEVGEKVGGGAMSHRLPDQPFVQLHAKPAGTVSVHTLM